jgi:hypothetical protein
MKRAPPHHPRTRSVPVLGVLASVTLHALLLTPTLIEAWGRAPRDADTPFGGHSVRLSSDEPPLIATFIDESDRVAKGAPTPYASESLLTSPDSFLIPVSVADMPEANVVVASDTSESQDVADDIGERDPGRAFSFGRYVGQISARIDRAWIKPRAPIAGGKFACRARILQSSDGGVKEIELESCDGDPAWQMSLVRAIQNASPLPAPPDPSVFSRSLQIEFEAAPYAPGDSAEGFEPESRQR